MKKFKRTIKIRASQAVWSLTLFFAFLTGLTVNNIIYELGDMDVGLLIYFASNLIWLLAATILFYKFSRRRIEIDTLNKTLSCKRLFKRKETIALSDIKEILNLEKLNKKKGFPFAIRIVSKKDGSIFKIPMDIISDNDIPPRNFYNFLVQRKGEDAVCDTSLLASDPKLQRSHSITIKIVSAMICVPIIGTYIYGLVSEIQGKPDFPIRLIAFYNYAVFWVLLVTLVIFILMMNSNKEHHKAVDFVACIIFLTYLPMLLIAGTATPKDYYVSATRDFTHYDETVAGKISHFPDKVEGGEVAAFSYYYCNYWDWVREVCLEVKYNDEEFDRIYSQYEEKEKSYFGENLEEVHFNDKYESLYLYEKESGEVEIAHANIELIIFDKDNNTVIYYFLSSADFLELDRCYLIERFGIDIYDYEEYIEERREKEN